MKKVLKLQEKHGVKLAEIPTIPAWRKGNGVVTTFLDTFWTITPIAEVTLIFPGLINRRKINQCSNTHSRMEEINTIVSFISNYSTDIAKYSNKNKQNLLFLSANRLDLLLKYSFILCSLYKLNFSMRAARFSINSFEAFVCRIRSLLSNCG